MEKVLKLSELTGKTAFLNGQPGLHEQEKKLEEKFREAGKETLVLDNLFDSPKKLSKVKDCENLVLSTTGMYREKLQPLMEAFKKLNYAPKKVFFLSENTAMHFVGMARDLKEKHGTEFYYPDLLSKEFFWPIGWL